MRKTIFMAWMWIGDTLHSALFVTWNKKLRKCCALCGILYINYILSKKQISLINTPLHLLN